jgi:hypothetical protein
METIESLQLAARRGAEEESQTIPRNGAQPASKEAGVASGAAIVAKAAEEVFRMSRTEENGKSGTHH